jgi:hypothetical protein
LKKASASLVATAISHPSLLAGKLSELDHNLSLLYGRGPLPFEQAKGIGQVGWTSRPQG